MPQITGQLEITLSVRDPVASAAWYCELLGMRESYDHTSDDAQMRYICLLEPDSGLVLCLVGHATNPGDDSDDFRCGLDHLEFLVGRREELWDWAARLDGMGVAHSGVKELDYTPNAMLTFRDPDNIQLEFFWRAPATAAGTVPDGYHSITPYFTVDDADRLIAFLEAAFDGEVLMLDRNERGRVRHARVSIGDSIMMLNEAGVGDAANASQVHLYVGDVDASFRAAIDAGAAAIMEPNQRPHGDRMAGIRDPCSNTWWLASPA